MRIILDYGMRNSPQCWIQRMIDLLHPPHTHVLSIFLLLALNYYFYNYFNHYKSTDIPGATQSSHQEKADSLLAASESCIFGMGSYCHHSEGFFPYEYGVGS